MSVLSVFEPTPNRVRALARLIGGLGPTSRAEVLSYLMPNHPKEDQFANILRETRRLNLITEDGGVVSLADGISRKELASDQWFVKFVEFQLLGSGVADTLNAVFPFALAWLLTQTPGADIRWNSEQHLNMQKQMSGDDSYGFDNSGRFAMLCYWAKCLGFVTSTETNGVNVVVPDPTAVLDRHIDTLLPLNASVPLTQFIKRLSEKLSVFEGGEVRTVVESRFYVKRPANQFSLSTSLAIARLVSKKRVRLENKDDANVWLMPQSLSGTGSGAFDRFSHIERRH